ncbi:MAG: cache and HAMP domain-containing protein [Candidatus Competibacteraceae bacterium]|nr:cache and HAMP domain-containing protein [Candidatus Competibacteraceae bacterium]
MTMVAVALVPLLGLLYIGGYKFERDWREIVQTQLMLTANDIDGRVNAWADTNLRALRENAALADMVSMDPARQTPVLKAIRGAYEWAYLVFSVNRDGQNIGRSDDNPPANYQYGDRDYFRQVIEGKPVGQEVVIGKTSQKPALILAGPIRDAGGALEGVLALAMEVAEISRIVASAKIGETGFAILIDENKKVIAHGRPQQITRSLQDLSAHPALSAAGAAQAPAVYDDAGERVIGHTRKTALGWTLIIQQNHDDAFAPLLEARRNALILMAFALALVLGVAYLLSRQLARPISELTAVADQLSRGNFDMKIVGTERRDEIGALARAVERMAVSIRMAFERLRKKT